MSTTSDRNTAVQLGSPVKDWTPPPIPNTAVMEGRTCRLEKLSASKHGADLYLANATDKDNVIWNYLPYGPFEREQEYLQWITEFEDKQDPMFYAIVEKISNNATGVASYLRLKPESGSIEVGHINYSPILQNTVAAMFLMMDYAFSLGYRRYEWKCDSLNKRSRNAALRLGFSYEGEFRQATVVKGLNRDTSWFSVIDSEWPALSQIFKQWLDPDNFDGSGQQITSLSYLTDVALPGRR